MSMIGNLLAIDDEELASLYVDPETVSDVLYEKYSEQVFDIDKSWHGIHFLLTGEQYGGEPPLAHVVFGVSPIGEEDVGYGPAMGTTAHSVFEIAEALAAVSDEDFRERYDESALNAADIYPQIWGEEEDALEYLFGYFKLLQEFYSTAAKDGKAVITFIN